MPIRERFPPHGNTGMPMPDLSQRDDKQQARQATRETVKTASADSARAAALATAHCTSAPACVSPPLPASQLDHHTITQGTAKHTNLLHTPPARAGANPLHLDPHP